jgi:hypothetical protein
MYICACPLLLDDELLELLLLLPPPPPQPEIITAIAKIKLLAIPYSNRDRFILDSSFSSIIHVESYFLRSKTIY